jgi:hypothetical protein
MPHISLSAVNPEEKLMMAKAFLEDPSGYPEERTAEYIKFITVQKKKILIGVNKRKYKEHIS